MADSRLGNDADILRVEPLRVVVLVDRTVSGGSEELLLELMRRMNPVRFTPALAICRGPVELDLIRDFQVSGGLLEQGRLRGLIRLTRLLRETADALLVVGAGESMFWGRLAGRFAKLSVIVSVLEARAVSVDRLPPIGWFNRLLYRWTDSFVVAGVQQSRYLVERERIPVERVRVIPPGVNVGRFNFEPAVPFAVRRELNLPEDAPLVGLANSGERKDTLSLFLQSSRSVLAARRDAHFVVFGEPHPLAEGDRQVSRTELDGRIHFVGKNLSIHRMVSALNVMCWMDGGEEMEIPILEAISAQVPVVVARGDLVNDKRSSVPNVSLPGCHVVSRASTPIADALLRILGDPELARQMGRSGRNEATRHGSIDRMVSAYEQLILEIYYRKNRTSIPSVESGGGEMEVCTAT